MAERLAKVFGYSAWVVLASYLLPAFVISAIAILLMQVGLIDTESLSSPAGLLMLVAAQFIVGFGILMTLPVWIQKLPVKEIKNLLGVSRGVIAKDIGVGLVALLGYLVVTVVVQSLMMQFLPGYNADEVQELGFSTDIVGLELVLAGIALVVLAPVFEELIFRGYLFGTIRKQIPFWLTAIVVSLVFAVAHGQVNVGVDVFILSIFMCVVREYTGSVWGTILMHMLKNGLAFTLLFIYKVV